MQGGRSPRYAVAKTVHFSGTRANVPELADILRRDEQLMALLIETAERAPSNPLQGMRPFNRRQENVGINEDSHLPAIWIEIFTA
jgi:hypothetical protein